MDHLITVAASVFTIVILTLINLITFASGVTPKPLQSVTFGVISYSVVLLPVLLTRAVVVRRRIPAMGHYLLANVLEIVIWGVTAGLGLFIWFRLPHVELWWRDR